MALLNPHQHDHSTNPDIGAADPAAQTTSEALQNPGVPGSFYNVPESTANTDDDVRGFSADTLTLEPRTADEEVTHVELKPGDEGMDHGGSDHTGEDEENYDNEPKKRGLFSRFKVPLGIGAVGLIAAAGVLGISKRGNDEGQQVSAGPVPTATSPSTPPTPTPEAPKPTNTPKAPVATTPLTQPPGHFPAVESTRGSTHRNAIGDQYIGDFQLGLSLKDLEIYHFDISKRCEGKENLYSIPDEDRTIVVSIDKTTGVVDGIHTENPADTDAKGIHVGSTRAEVEQAYGSEVKPQIFAVDTENVETLVLIEPRHGDLKTVFALDQGGKVASIDIFDLRYDNGAPNDKVTAGPLTMPKACEA